MCPSLYPPLPRSSLSLLLSSYALVYDLGAHTLSLSLLLVTGGMYCEMVTRCVEGVGGRECDEVIANFLANEFER